MTNRVRTLLLNRGRDGVSPTALGEEYIDPGFRPRTLSGAVKRAWEFLFGLRPDRLFRNWRLRQLLTLIHTSELADRIYIVDPRVTYWPFADDLFPLGTAAVLVREAGDGDDPFLFGSPPLDESAGISSRMWLIVADSGEQVTITDLLTQITTSLPVTYNLGLSDPVTIPNTSLTLRFRELSEGDAWSLTTSARPAADIGELLAGCAAVLGETDITTLFAGSDPNYLAIWRKHPHPVTRYAALLLAIADAIDASPPSPE